MTTDSPLNEFFGDHLKELRQRVLFVFCTLVFFTAVAYYFAKPLAFYLVRPIFQAAPEIKSLVYTHLTEAFISYLKIAVLAGVSVSLPIVCYQLWMFVSPGLSRQEKRTAIKVSFWSASLFLAGSAFAYFVALPEILTFLISSAGTQLEAMPRLDSYLTFVARTVITFGIAFEVPFLMVAAGRTGLVSREYFVEKRWISYIVILVIAFLLVAGDLLAAVLLALPLAALYEAGIVMTALFGRQKVEEQPSDPDNEP